MVVQLSVLALEQISLSARGVSSGRLWEPLWTLRPALLDPMCMPIARAWPHACACRTRRHIVMSNGRGGAWPSAALRWTTGLDKAQRWPVSEEARVYPAGWWDADVLHACSQWLQDSKRPPSRRVIPVRRCG